jgi:hypothetical protein
MRLITAEGGIATIIHRGDEQSGATFVTLRHRDGTMSCAGPAPQTQAQSGERKLEWRARNSAEREIDTLIDRERRFDRDLWCVEVECAEPLFVQIFELT